MRRWPELACLGFLTLVLGLPGRSPASAIDEGSAARLGADPSPFSPAFSPDKKDWADIGFDLSRELPVSLRILNGPAEVRVVPPAEIQRCHGWLGTRWRWNGADGNGAAVPDGIYDLELVAHLVFNWRRGDAVRPPAGLLREPHALAVEPVSGRLFVASASRAADVFDRDGAFVRRVDFTPAPGAPRFGAIGAMVFAPDGQLLLLTREAIGEADAASGTVRKLADLPVGARADWLDDLAVDAHGNILFCCARAGRIFRFQRDGTPAGEVEGIFHPVALAVAGERLWVVTQSAHGGGVQRIDPGESEPTTFGTRSCGGPIPLLAPRAIAALSDGSVVLAEGAGGPLGPVGNGPLFCRLDANGKVLGQWGRRGGGTNEVCFVSRLAAAGGEFYLSDHYGHHRVLRGDSAGQVRQVYAAPPGAIAEPAGLIRWGADRLLAIDAGLARGTLFDRQGQPLSMFSFWAAFDAGAADAPVGVCGDGRGDRLYLLQAGKVITLDGRGAKLGEVKLDTPVATYGSIPPGLFVAPDGRMFVTGSYAEPPSADAPEFGKLLVFDAAGAKRFAVGVDGAALYGPLVPLPSDRLAVQAWRKDARGRDEFAACVLRQDGSGSPQVERCVWLQPRPGVFLHPDGVFAMNAGGLFKGGSSLAFFDGEGKMLWTLGDMQDKPYHPAALLWDGAEILSVNAGSGALESWSFCDPRPLARGAVEVDNTPPAVAITGDDIWAVLDGGLFVLRGTATDKNFEHYDVFYRRLSAAGDRPPSWLRVRAEPYTNAVAAGELARWEVPASWRDAGIETRVVGWDAAGNSTESLSRPITFDEDGDGYSNPQELAQGTDPRTKTLELDAGLVQIRPDARLLVTPYFFADATHELKFTAWDLRQPDNPVPIPGCAFRVTADAGQFDGGGLTTPAAGDTNDFARATVRAAGGVARWTAPNTDDLDVPIGVELEPRFLGNVKLPAVRLDLSLRVRRDDDHDWAPDATEVPPGDPTLTAGCRGVADSDGDGVLDGFDLAPRTAYNDTNSWSQIYAPGMIRYTQEMFFYGIGGGDSHVTKYGDVIKGDAILRSDRVDTSAALTDYLNDLLFHRGAKNPSDRQPFEVVDWEGFAATPPEEETDKIGEYTFSGTGHPTLNFVYYARTSRGTPIIENVEAIDGARWSEGGIHRNYLKVSAPGTLDHFDRTVTVQWKITGADRTSANPRTGAMTRMAWMLEAFDHEDLKGVHRHFSGLMLAEDAGNGVYQATLIIPSERCYRGVPLFLKLTPCWFTRQGGERACERCGTRSADAVEVCPACGASLNRIRYDRLNRAILSVSAVRVESPAEVIRYIQRMQPRGGTALTADDLDAVIAAAPQAVLQERAWPLCNHAMLRTVTAGGRPVSVLFCSLRAINQLPANLLPRQVEARVQELAAYTSSQLASADVVCLIANDARKMQNLVERIEWGPPGAWYTPSEIPAEPGPATPDTAPGGGAASGTGETSGAGGGALATAKQVFSATKDLIMLGKEAYSLISHNAIWMPAQRAVSGPEWAITRIGAKFSENEVDAVTGKPMSVGRTIYVQKLDEGMYRVSSRTFVDRPYTVWTDPRTGETFTDFSTRQELVLLRTEKVGDLNDSKIIEREFDVVGTKSFQRSLMIAKLKTVVKIGGPAVSNGLKIYQCLTKGDTVGVAVYGLKGAAEVTQAIAEVKGVKGFLTEGLRVPGMVATKFNVVAAATGMLEAGYYLYQAGEAPNPIESDILAQKAAGAVIDAGIGAIEPYGAVILASWTVGGMLGNKIADLMGLGNNEIASAAAESPGQGLMCLPRHLAPGTVSPLDAKDAARYAQRDAIKKVEAQNAVFPTKLTWIWVPPKE